jgi:hypothetical protein
MSAEIFVAYGFGFFLFCGGVFMLAAARDMWRRG